jgi:hypothetical protein
MSRTRRIAAALVFSSGLLAVPALTAAPASAELPCAWAETPGATSPWNYPIDGVACVVLDTSSGIRLVAVTDVQPGWTYQVKSAGGTAASSGSRVEIRFENKSTKQTVNFRFEPGKTVIR